MAESRKRGAAAVSEGPVGVEAIKARLPSMFSSTGLALNSFPEKGEWEETSPNRVVVDGSL
jgi:hypothetical protein